MLTAFNAEKQLVVAKYAPRGEEHHCPGCSEAVTLRRGAVVVAHYAHRAGSSCGYGTGESEAHMRAKMGVYEALKGVEGVSDLMLERPMKTVRPDVSFVWNGTTKVVVEVQCSDIALDLIEHRWKIYSERGCHMLWCSPERLRGPWSDAMGPTDWERHIHDINGGVYYYLGDGQELRPAHFFGGSREFDNGRFLSSSNVVGLYDTPITLITAFAAKVDADGRRRWAGDPDVWMTRRTVSRVLMRCGHSEPLPAGVGDQEVPRYVRDAAQRLCAPCLEWARYVQERAKDRAAGLPDLIGTPKQQAWAQRVRIRTLEGLKRGIDQCYDKVFEASDAADEDGFRDAINRLRAVRDVRFWIETEHSLFEDLFGVLDAHCFARERPSSDTPAEELVIS